MLRLGNVLHVAFEQLLGLRGQRFPHRWICIQNLPKIFAVNPYEFHVIKCRTRCRAEGSSAARSEEIGPEIDHGRNQTDLAECPTRTEIVEHSLLLAHALRDFHKAAAHLEKIGGQIPLTENNLPLFDAHQFCPVLEYFGAASTIALTETGKHREFVNFAFERMAAVGVIQNRAGRLAPLQHMENIFIDFKELCVFDGDHRGRTGIVVQTAHDAKNHIGRRDLIDPLAVNERERAATASMHILALVYLAARPGIGRALHPIGGCAHKGLERPFVRVSFRVCSSDRDAHPPLNDEKRRRAIRSLAADHIAGPIDASLNGVRIPFQKLGRNASKNLIELELLWHQHGALGREAVALILRLLEKTLAIDELIERECSGGTRHHALPTGNAARRAHRIIQIKSNAGGIALASSTDDVVFLDIRAGAHAAVAEDALIVIDGNSQRGGVASAIDCTG